MLTAPVGEIATAWPSPWSCDGPGALIARHPPSGAHRATDGELFPPAEEKRPATTSCPLTSSSAIALTSGPPPLTPLPTEDHVRLFRLNCASPFTRTRVAPARTEVKLPPTYTTPRAESTRMAYTSPTAPFSCVSDASADHVPVTGFRCATP